MTDETGGGGESGGGTPETSQSESKSATGGAGSDSPVGGAEPTQPVSQADTSGDAVDNNGAADSVEAGDSSNGDPAAKATLPGENPPSKPVSEAKGNAKQNSEANRDGLQDAKNLVNALGVALNLFGSQAEIGAGVNDFNHNVGVAEASSVAGKPVAEVKNAAPDAPDPKADVLKQDADTGEDNTDDGKEPKGPETPEDSDADSRKKNENYPWTQRTPSHP
jgi:hypothetical protein